MPDLEAVRKFFEGDKYAPEISGIVIEKAEKGHSVVSLEPDHRHLNAVGGLMGAVYYTLADEIKVPDGLERYGEQNILVQSLYCDTAGRIWLSSLTPGSTYVYSSGAFSRFKGFQTLPADTAVSSIMQEQSGAFWYGIAPHYAVRTDGKGGEQVFDLSFGESESTMGRPVWSMARRIMCISSV